MRWLTAVPVYNEAKSVRRVLAEVRRYSPDILVVNDGSTDGTAARLDAIQRSDPPDALQRTVALGVGPPSR